MWIDLCEPIFSNIYLTMTGFKNITDLIHINAIFKHLLTIAGPKNNWLKYLRDSIMLVEIDGDRMGHYTSMV